MLSKLRSRLTYANVMATVAVFLALGGSSYAALRVGSRQLVDNSVRTKDIRNNDVRSKDVRNSTLLKRDFKPGQLPAGPTGPRGLQGLKGDKGDRGDPGISGLQRVGGTTTPTNTTSPKFAPVQCPAGKEILSVEVIGVSYAGTPPYVASWSSNPGGSGSVSMAKSDGMSFGFNPGAVCANVAP
jgi:hypothetical protein